MTCELVQRRDRGEAPLWDRIRRTPGWDVVHAFGTSVEGWLVLVARRHVTAVSALTDDEAAEVGPLLKEVSRALEAVVGCPKTYVVQFAEHPDHPHVHIHVIPRAAELPIEHRGPGAFALLGVADPVTDDRMDALAQRLNSELRI